MPRCTRPGSRFRTQRPTPRTVGQRSGAAPLPAPALGHGPAPSPPRGAWAPHGQWASCLPTSGATGPLPSSPT
eukprot:4895139-Prymnesium_polylepis.1